LITSFAPLYSELYFDTMRVSKYTVSLAQTFDTTRRLSIAMLIGLVSLMPAQAYATDKDKESEEEAYKPLGEHKALSPKFWVVNFGTAKTLAPGKFGFAAGMGGQMVFLGEPRKTSAFFTIPHAGFRLGLAQKLDAGLRLAPIPLPFASVGPGFGINLDVKYNFTNPESRVQAALILGAGGAHVHIQDVTRYAYSPNVAALTSFALNETTDFTIMGRYVNLAIPTAPEGGARGNFVNITGASFGWRKSITPTISILPEVGAYWYEGQMATERTSGPGFQYGVMIATSF
jgi:hypothetical protein